MLINYLRTALRGLTRAKTHALINIGGLAVGMAISILIGLWIKDELSYDKYHRHYDRIVQVLQKEKFLGHTKVWDHLPYALFQNIRINYQGPFEHMLSGTRNGLADPHSILLSASTARALFGATNAIGKTVIL